MSVAPYPHVEMHVRDDSIYTPIETEVLPLHKPLYMMRAQKGPVGVPVWCDTYSYACRVFGNDTFDKNSEYFSEQAYFLLQTFPSNGAFIMRVASTDAKSSEISIELGVSKASTVTVPQWLRDDNGRFVYELDGSKIPINDDGEECKPVSPAFKLTTDTVFASGKQYYVIKNSVYVKATVTTDMIGQPIPDNTYYEKQSTAVEVYARELSSVALDRPGGYFTRKTNYVYSDVPFGQRRYKGVTYYKLAAASAATLTKCAATDAFDATKFYFVVDETASTVTPAFELTKATYDETKATTVYATFNSAAASYVEKTDGLPPIEETQAIGDKFLLIDQSAVAYTAGTGAAASTLTMTGYTLTGDKLFKAGITYYTKSGEMYTEAPVTVGNPVTANTYYVKAEAKYGTYVFTAAVDEANPFTYVSASTVPGSSIVGLTLYYKYGELNPGQLEPQAKISGYKLAWRAHVRGTSDSRPIGSTEPKDSDNFTWYPMLDVVAENPGVWGQKFGVKLYFDATKNTVSGTLSNEGVTYTFAPVQLVGDATTPSEITDAYQQTSISGIIRPNAIDPSTDTDLSIDKRITASYSGKQALPIICTWNSENWDKVGKLLMKKEISQRAQILKLYPKFRTIINASGDELAETYVDALFSKVATDADIDADNAGYLANVLSCIDSENIPYFTAEVVDSTDTLVSGDTKIVPAKVVVPTSYTPIYLGSGEDGDISDAAVEGYIQAQITSTLGGTQEYLIDYARCPFNSIIDTGVSLTTKKAYLDLLSVRDSLVVNLSTQSTWKKADGSTPAVNLRYDDESIGSSLRAYAWLMREDVLNGTECCRAKIFLHAGYTSDHIGAVASTLWIALKNAQYLNRQYIYKEAKELPNSSIDCYTKLSWVAASEDTKSRCWNAGLNYAQYYTMKNFHYASVRTVYRYETSVLVDAGVVDALTFMKDEVRRSWATWAGSTRPALEINQLITEDLTQRFSYLLNGKYQSAVQVYQTDEDMKLGYVRHVDITLTSPATNRVWIATIICKRENYEPEA